MFGTLDWLGFLSSQHTFSVTKYIMWEVKFWLCLIDPLIQAPSYIHLILLYGNLNNS
jgi:hypothetical protein